MAKLRMAHASTHGARKPPGPKLLCYKVRAEAACRIFQLIRSIRSNHRQQKVEPLLTVDFRVVLLSTSTAEGSVMTTRKTKTTK